MAVKKKIKKTVVTGNVYIQAGYNNTLVTITDLSGDTLSWSSSGSCGFKGSKKSTPYAAQVAAQTAADAAKTHGLQEVHVFVKGVGSGREQSIRSLQTSGISVLSITDITPVAHGGCRPRKARRV
jgi:small subunit ribosomal protein S11